MSKFESTETSNERLSEDQSKKSKTEKPAAFASYEEAVAWVEGQEQDMLSPRETSSDQNQENRESIRFAEAEVRQMREHYLESHPEKGERSDPVHYHDAFHLPNDAPQELADLIVSYKAGMKGINRDLIIYRDLKWKIEQGQTPWAEELEKAIRELDSESVTEIERRTAAVLNCLREYISSLETNVRLAEDKKYWEDEIAPGAARLKRYEALDAFLKTPAQASTEEEKKALFIKRAEALREQQALAEIEEASIGGFHQRIYLYSHPELIPSKEYASR